MELPVWTIQHQSRLRGTPHPPTPHRARKGKEAQPSLARLGRTGAFAMDAQAGVGVDTLTLLLIDNMFDVSIGYDVSKCRD
jgi:hypothetical protein